MTPGRALSLLTGVALLGAIAAFNEMTPDARASFIGDVRTAAQSWLATAVAAYNGMTAAREPPASAPASPRAAEGRDGRGAPPQRTAGAEPPPNPLWALPLRQLSVTRDRPVFSPSRRPPPPPPTFVAPVAAVRQVPVPPPEPERPQVTLIGTIIGTKAEEQIAVFLDSKTQSVIRLHVGEDHQGWVLRQLKVREATLEKAQQTAVLTIQTTGEGQAPGGGPLLPGMPGMMPGIPPGGMPGAPGIQVNGNPANLPQVIQQRQRRQR
jgi:hypothetical protein